MIKAYVAVTDADWYRFLQTRPGLDEVNFWQPGGRRLFATLSRGQPPGLSGLTATPRTQMHSLR